MVLVDNIDALGHAADSLQAAENRKEWAAAMTAWWRAMEALQEIAPELVERGVHAGMTQVRMARLLGVPASTLRGAKREFAR